jgi:hypothetical protein
MNYFFQNPTSKVSVSFEMSFWYLQISPKNKQTNLTLPRWWYVLGFPAGLSRPGKSREGPGTGRDRTGPRDLEGPVVLAGQDLETLKVPGLFLKVPGPPGPFFPPKISKEFALVYQF